MILRKKGFTLIEMLVVIMIIAILAAALFPAIAAAIAQAKSTAVKNKGRGIWTSVLSANAEREPLGMVNVWPTTAYATSTAYFQFLMGTAPYAPPAVCEDLKYATLVGPGMPSAASLSAFAPANNAWCIASPVSSNNISEDAFIYTRNIDFGSVTYAAGKATVANADVSRLTTDATILGGWNLNRGIYVTYGGACIDRRDKYIGVDVNSMPTNNLVSSTNAVVVTRPSAT